MKLSDHAYASTVIENELLKSGTRLLPKDQWWCVQSLDQKTREKVVEKLQECGIMFDCSYTIHYGGKEISVILVTHGIIEHLKKNRRTEGYAFIAFRKEAWSLPWGVWKEGEASPNKLLGNRFQGQTNKLKKRSAPV